jgi:DNA-binding IclR family transcriptional regulator
VSLEEPEALTGADRILVLDKAFAILDLLAEDQNGLRIIDIQRGLGIPRPTVHRLLGMLTEHRYVVRDDHDRYRLGLRVYELGMRVHAGSSALDVISRELEAIADDLDLTAYLSVRRGEFAMCLARVDRGALRITDYQIGETLPLTVGGGPKIILAGMTDSEIDTVLTGGRLHVFTTNTLASRRDVLTAVAEIRERGYAIGAGDHVEVQTAIGVPLHDGAGTPAGAISVAMFRPRPLEGEVDRIVDRLRSGTAALARLRWSADEIAR